MVFCVVATPQKALCFNILPLSFFHLPPGPVSLHFFLFCPFPLPLVPSAISTFFLSYWHSAHGSLVLSPSLYNLSSAPKLVRWRPMRSSTMLGICRGWLRRLVSRFCDNNMPATPDDLLVARGGGARTCCGLGWWSSLTDQR